MDNGHTMDVKREKMGERETERDERSLLDASARVSIAWHSSLMQPNKDAFFPCMDIKYIGILEA